MNLVQKLMEVRKRVVYVQKDSDAHKGKYASESSLISAIRPHIDELGLFLHVTHETCEVFGPQADKAQLKIVFTWINADDPTQHLSSNIFLQCKAGDPQGIGGLMTYAMRYFIAKSFTIATDTDDPDYFVKQMEKGSSLSDQQKTVINGLLSKDPDREARTSAMLKHYGVKSLDELPREKFDQILGALLKDRKGVDSV